MHKSISIFVGCLLILTIFFSCKKKPRTDFTAEEKVLYDSLKIVAFKDIRSNTDKRCDEIKDSLFNLYVDSLLVLRREEINQLFEN